METQKKPRDYQEAISTEAADIMAAHGAVYLAMQVRTGKTITALMAAFISIIRPGKAHLQNQPWLDVFASVWDGDDRQGYTFKKSHSLSYAMLVVLHMNLLNQAVAPM